jgi:hypothetical protein
LLNQLQQVAEGFSSSSSRSTSTSQVSVAGIEDMIGTDEAVELLSDWFQLSGTAADKLLAHMKRLDAAATANDSSSSSSTSRAAVTATAATVKEVSAMLETVQGFLKWNDLLYDASGSVLAWERIAGQQTVSDSASEEESDLGQQQQQQQALSAPAAEQPPAAASSATATDPPAVEPIDQDSDSGADGADLHGAHLVLLCKLTPLQELCARGVIKQLARSTKPAHDKRATVRINSAWHQYAFLAQYGSEYSQLLPDFAVS